MRVWSPLLTACLLIAPLVSAGDADNPDVEDPAGDQEGYNPSNEGCNPNFGETGRDSEDWQDIDVLTAWLREDGDVLAMGLTTTADIGSGTYAFGFTVGEEDLVASHSGGSYDGPEGGSSTAEGTMLSLLVPKAAVGLADGGTVADWTISASRPDEDRVPQLCGDNWAYRDFTDPLSFTLASAASDLLAEAEPATVALNGTLEVLVRFFNNGTEAENVSLAASADPLSVTYDDTVSVPVNGSVEVPFQVDAAGAGVGAYVLNVTFAGLDGANRSIEVPIEVVEAEDLPVNATDGDAAADGGNGTLETDDAPASNEEAPGPMMLLALVASVVVARRRAP